ncbi:hypothetical protein [Nocardia sp. CY41]|uniref:hypothetical protein n=1 Tax=Nocardia sp. CY41 TaxID=2608686 RepID=UPI00135CE6E9|nr:hypothetical protein [Nocardia sp. CY41]
MVTPAAAPHWFAESDPTANGGSRRVPVGIPGVRTPPRSGLDAQLAPLRIPAVVLGVGLLAAGVVALVPLRGWWRDYGGPLVVVAYLQYLGVAATVMWWGLRGAGRHRQSSWRGMTPEKNSGPHVAGQGRSR